MVQKGDDEHAGAHEEGAGGQEAPAAEAFGEDPDEEGGGDDFYGPEDAG